MSEHISINSSVRSARAAVLINAEDQHWQHTVVRIIEWATRSWGGSQHLIVPTNGKNIPPQGWAFLEQFDPDYLLYYKPRGADLRLRDPNEFDRLVQSQTDKFLAANPSSSREYIQPEIERGLNESVLDRFGISDELQQELKHRLAPFYFDRWIVESGAISAGIAPRYPLTDVTDIVKSIDAPQEVTIINDDLGLLPPCWLGAAMGTFDATALEKLAEAGVRTKKASFGNKNYDELFRIALKDPFSNNSLPSNVSRIGLSFYRSLQFHHWEEPTIVVAGNTLQDFCLYFNLSRLRDRVFWVPPVLTSDALNGTKDSAAIAFWFSNMLFDVAEQITPTQLVLISATLSEEQLTSVGKNLEEVSRTRQRSSISVKQFSDALIKYPLMLYETNNHSNETTLQFESGVSVSRFQTPKPRNFRTLNASSHRWICDLSLNRKMPPRHSALGTVVVSDRRLTTHEARVGLNAASYFCPNVMVFAAEVDTILVRPQIVAMTATEIATRIASEAGLEVATSDKGIYTQQAIDKWQGLGNVGQFLRSESNRKLLTKFLDISASSTTGGVYLKDQRRYLDMIASQEILGNEASSVIEDLAAKGILKTRFHPPVQPLPQH